MNKILLVDDDKMTLNILKKVFTDVSYRVHTATRGTEALDKLSTDSYSVIISDVKMPGMSGLELLEKIREQYPQTAVIMMTAHGSIEDAVSAMKRGAMDYILKPFSAGEVLLTVQKVLEQQELFKENRYLKEEVKRRYGEGIILGRSQKIQELREVLRKAANTEVTVLIRGETGTGKELAARALHYESDRRERIFVAVNCAALTETLLESELFGHEKGAFTGAVKRKIGKFELANKGTLFLDEIGDISLTTQTKLLRVLQEKEFERVGGNEIVSVDVRVIAATNRNLEQLIAEGKFREDFYYRLNVLPIYIPPLRERTEDIPILAEHFLELSLESTKKSTMKISWEAMESLVKYPWPGNIRELKNILERAVLMEDGSVITRFDLPDHPKGAAASAFIPPLDNGYIPPFFEWKASTEKIYFTQLLRKTQGSINRAFQIARIDRKSLYEKMKKYGLDKEMFKTNEDISPQK